MDQVPGLIPSPIDHRQAQYEAVFPMGGPVAPRDSRSWSAYLPAFRWQHPLPTCVSHAQTAIQYALNKAAGEGEPLCSPLNLFVEAGGSILGSRMDSNAEVAMDRPVLESDKPYPTVGQYSSENWGEMQEYARSLPNGAVERGAPWKVKSYQWVLSSSATALLDALEHSPVSLGLQVHGNYFHAEQGWTFLERAPWHVVVGVQLLANGSWLVFDSLMEHQGFDGFHLLPADYPIGFVMSFRDLPTNWQQDQRSWLEQQYPHAYVHYGLPRLPLATEQAQALKLRRLVESYPDVGIRAIAARYWIVLVNAYLYGGYSAEVTGPDGRRYFAYRDHGSDLANALYQFRRTGSFPFDFDKLRSEQ